jgi:pimeloyl-ACP methyl ester carboxylesterase
MTCRFSAMGSGHDREAEADVMLGERMSPVEHEMVVDGMDFRVLSSASAQRPADAVFVLIHGIGTSHRYMARLHDELARSNDVHSIDVPGFGGLPKPVVAPSVTLMAAALGALLDELRIQSAVLVGHSMGAQWVVELAVIRPALARAVVAIGPVTDDAHRSLLSQSVALGVDTLGEPPSVNIVVFSDYLRCGPSWFLKEARYMVNYPIEDRVMELDIPFLVIRGGNDPIAGIAWCRRLRNRAKQGSLVVIPGHRHVAQFTAPRAVASAITAFVAQAAPQSEIR